MPLLKGVPLVPTIGHYLCLSTLASFHASASWLPTPLPNARCGQDSTGRVSSWAVNDLSHPDQQCKVRGTGCISALEAARENTVTQPLSSASEVPGTCPSDFLIIHSSCQMLVSNLPSKRMRTLIFLWDGAVELSFEWNESPLWRTGSFVFAATVVGLELVISTFCGTS